MITPEERTLELGSTDYVWVRCTEKTGADVSGTDVALRLVSPLGVPGAWATPDDMDRSTDGVIRAAILFTPDLAGLWKVQVKLMDSPTTTVETAGLVQVVA